MEGTLWMCNIKLYCLGLFLSILKSTISNENCHRIEAGGAAWDNRLPPNVLDNPQDEPA